MITDNEIAEITRSALAQIDVKGKRILVIIPDGTRTAPIPQMFRLLCGELLGKVAALDFLIALGTHKPMSQTQIDKLVGVKPEEWSTTFAGVHVYNHEWDKEETFITLATITPSEITLLTTDILPPPVDARRTPL